MRILGVTKERFFLTLATLVVCVVYLMRITPAVWDSRGISILSGGAILNDGWISADSTLTVPGFASILNKVEFVLGTASSGAQGRIAYSMCGGDERSVEVPSETVVSARIPIGCSPLRVSFRPESPKQESLLARTQLRRLQIVSPFGAVPSMLRIVSVGGALGLLVALTVLAVGRSKARAAAGYGVLLVVLALSFCSDLEAKKFVPLWLFSTAFILGVALYRGDSRSSVESESSERWLLVALLLGAGLRFYGINFGLPSNFHPDEVPKVNAIMRLVDQDTWDPQYFLHPSLLLYLTYFMNCLIRALGIDGSFRESAFLAGRLVSATAGTLSIVLVYELARRLYSRRSAIASALLLAVIPLHVTCSRYLKEDALLTFLVLSCTLATVIAVKSDRRWMLLIAGVVAGCTAGAKYSGILMAGLIGAVPWIVSRSWLPDRRWLVWAAAGVAIAPLGFLFTTPFAILNAERFLHDFAAEARHMRSGHTQSIDAWSQLWMYHFSRSLIPGMTWIIAVGSIVGLGLLARRRKVEDLIVVGLFLLFYLPAEFVKAKPAPQPERYIVPCLPFLAIALAELLRLLGKRTFLKAGFALSVIFVLLFPFIRTVSLASEIKHDTRDLLADWMRRHIPAGATVLMDWQPYCPRFHNDEFDVQYIPRAHIIPKLDIKHLRNSRADYLVLSNLYYDRYFKQPESNPLLRQRLREVFERVPVVRQFVPIYGTYGFHNPVLTIFSLKQEDFEGLERELVRKRSGEISETSNDIRARGKW